MPRLLGRRGNRRRGALVNQLFEAAFQQLLQSGGVVFGYGLLLLQQRLNSLADLRRRSRVDAGKQLFLLLFGDKRPLSAGFLLVFFF